FLAPLTGTDGDQQTLDLALAVARGANTHIAALFVKPDPADALAYAGVANDGMALQGIVDQMEVETEQAAGRARQRFEAWRPAHDPPLLDKPGKGTGVGVAYRERVGPLGETIVAAGRVTDLIVQPGLRDESPGAPESALEAALFGSGRPVLIAPLRPPA